MAGFLQQPLIDRACENEPFLPGDLAADRFEIIRLIAEGGMAIVYAALDRKADHVVALKVPKLPFRRRLLAELRSALEVTHPNICRVHAIHSSQSRIGAIDFLTMEYLEGETLGQRLRSGGTVSLEETAEITRQICSGLAAAHDHDIIHGDLKPNNIILTTTRGGKLRAVITDFGLARLAPVASDNQGQLASELRGAPDFLAPELWRGMPSSNASDIYALGAIVYEMLTGTRPHTGVPLESRLSALPAPPLRLAPNIPKEWSGKVLACLSPTASKRPANVHDIAQVFRAEPRRRRLVWAGVAVVLAGVAAAVVLPILRTPSPGLVRLAILPPSTDAESVVQGNGIALDWSSRLVGADPLRPVVIIPASSAAYYHVRSADAARSVLGATHALQLATKMQAGRIVVSATLRDVAAGRELGSFHEIQRADRQLSSILDVEVSERTSVNPAAYWDYVQGLYHLKEAPNPAQAASFFERARSLDPNSVLPLVALVQTELLRFRHSGDSSALTRARKWEQLAFRLGPGDPRTLLARASLAEAAGDSRGAEAAYRQAAVLEPGNGGALRALAALLSRLNRRDDAVRAFRAAIAAEPGYIQPLMDAGVFHYFRGEYKDASDYFQEVTRVAPQLWQARQNLAAVYADTGQFALAEREFQQALTLGRDAGTFGGMGAVLAYQKRHAESAYYYEQAVALGPDDFLLHSNLGDAYRRTGRGKDSLRAYGRALSIARESLASAPGNAYTRAFTAYLLIRLGEPVQADREIQAALRDAPGDSKILRRAILLHEAAGQRQQSLALLRLAPPAVRQELARHPDLADFCLDPRFIKLKDGSAASAP
ncbi:MAG: protein kinase [Bryobacterales bacterium]|nr:protein kinase [Bryobacterales bacterium]